MSDAAYQRHKREERRTVRRILEVLQPSADAELLVELSTPPEDDPRQAHWAAAAEAWNTANAPQMAEWEQQRLKKRRRQTTEGDVSEVEDSGDESDDGDVEGNGGDSGYEEMPTWRRESRQERRAREREDEMREQRRIDRMQAENRFARSVMGYDW
jgi:hypothetical protein